MSGTATPSAASNVAPSSAPSGIVATSAPASRTRNVDIGWTYSFWPDPSDKNKIQCKLCDMNINGGIYRLKQHITKIKGNVVACQKQKPEDIRICKEALDATKTKKNQKVLRL